jgi:hypothetical protein
MTAIAPASSNTKTAPPGLLDITSYQERYLYPSLRTQLKIYVMYREWTINDRIAITSYCQ